MELLRSLSHPNIIRLYETYDNEGKIYMITELCTGGELFDRIVSYDHYSEERAAHAFAQMAEAIGHCHAHGIVHRDLKPENLLLDSEQQLRIADFGLSTRCAPGQVLKHSCGSPCYAAPEMLTRVGQQMGYVGHPVDLWSCGVTLYAMLCGCLPFEHANTSSLYKKIIAGNYSEPRHLSRDARDILISLAFFALIVHILVKHHSQGA